MSFELEQSASDITETLRSAAAQVMVIEDTTLGAPEQFAVRFRGRLVIDSQEAYARVAQGFGALGYTALFRKDGTRDAVLAVRGKIIPRPSNAWINLLMFALTVLSALFAGSWYDLAARHPELLTATRVDEMQVILLALRELWAGWPFALSILLILGTHEFGHYFAARFHKIAVTLPYFIPFPLSPFGTMGAVIQLKEPPTNRRVLLDIGVAGPLAGFIVAVPVLVYGLLTSPVQALPFDQTGGFEGNSIFYIFTKLFIFGKFLPQPALFDGLPPLLAMVRFYVLGIFPSGGGQDVILNQVAWAGWAGLLVTGLNLIPAGQLDGGHALYVLVGQKARRLIPFIIGALLVLGLFWTGWFLWAAIIYFMGRTYAEPLDQITELDPRRKILAGLALVLFVLVITPIPLT